VISVLLSACISAAPTEEIFVKFDMGDRMTICRETPYVLNIVQEYRVLHMTIYVRLIVVGDVSAPYKRFCATVCIVIFLTVVV